MRLKTVSIILFSFLFVIGSFYFIGDVASNAEEDIVYIYTAEDLDKIRLDMKGHYVLANDIDLDVAPYNEGSGWYQIGDGEQGRFEGTFDGAGYTIKGLTIDRSSGGAPHADGLFGEIFRDAVIKNVTLEDVNIISTHNTGALVGEAGSGTLIENVTVTGTIEGAGDVGGVAGSLSNATMKNSHANVVINGVTSVGGLVGHGGGENTVINNSTSEGSVTARDTVGGLVGNMAGKLHDSSSSATVKSTRTNDDVANAGGLVGKFSPFRGEIINSFATGDVEAIVDNVGGLTGYASVTTEAMIENSYATGTVTGRNYVGGLVGYYSDVLISDSYAKGNVYGENQVGGLIGLMENEHTTIQKSFSEGDVMATGSDVGGFIGKMTSHTTIKDAYAQGAVTGGENTGGFIGSMEVATIQRSYATGEVDSNGDQIGGFVGNDHRGEYFNNYYDQNTTGMNDTTGATPKSTNEMYERDTFSNWNFTSTWKNSKDQYPLLREEPFTLITDIADNYWGRDAITEAFERGVVSGSPDPNNENKFIFKPVAEITRAEMVIMVVNALEVQTSSQSTTFKDDSQIPNWAKDHVAAAQDLGIVEGDAEGNFHPNQFVTRAEMAAMVERAFNLQPTTTGELDFVDKEDIPTWAQSSIAAIVDNGIMQGRDGNRFVPLDNSARAEAAVTLLNALTEK